MPTGAVAGGCDEDDAMDRTRRLVGVAVLLTTVLAACGADPGGPNTVATRGGTEPLTPRALAALVAEHTSRPSSATLGRDMEELGNRVVAAVELRYDADGEYDGDLLAVAVGTRLESTPQSCDGPAAQELSGCAQLDGGTLLWESHTPEEDPGVVYLQVSKGDTDVVLFYAGPDITDDPRELAMPISVEDMLAIAADPRVDVTTSAEAVKAGETIDYWEGAPG
jgi:hypothetical protein